MEVMMPSPAGSTTCISPESPQGGSAANYFFSSPTYSSVFHRQFSFSTTGCNTPLSQNLHQEIFSHNKIFEEDEDGSTKDFAFDFSGQLDSIPSLSAEELFDGGKIKPLEPSPPPPPPPPPGSPKRILKNAYEKTVIETRRDNTLLEGRDIDRRGRERVYESSNSRRQQTVLSKSLSPLRTRNMVSERINNRRTSKQTSVPSSLVTSSSWYGKWKLTDFLLFRSASEGHATNKRYDFFRKISRNEDLKNSSFRSTDSGGLGSSGRRKNGNVSAHEWHYKVNRAVAEEMRRKTFLPYKKNLISCMDTDGGVCELFLRDVLLKI